MSSRHDQIIKGFDLRYQEERENKLKTLFYENVNLNNIAQRYNTPIYIYSKNKIIENCQNFTNAFIKNNIKNFQICYAMKACNNSTILKIIKSCKCGIDAVSVEEIQKALFLGFKPSNIVFSGVGKTQNDLEFSIKNKISQINVESIEELQDIIDVADKLKIKANIGIRINPDIKASTNKKISTGSKTNKFGINVKDLTKAFEIIKNKKNISLLGLSIHIGSQITNLNDFDKAFKFIANIYKQHPEFKTIDLGGGLGINYKLTPIFPKKEDYVKLITKYFGDFSGKIIIEMGRSIIGDAGIFLTKIVRTKQTKTKNFIIVDGGMNNLIRPAMYNAWHEPLLINKTNEKKSKKYDIVGPICESSDVFNKDVAITGFDETKTNYIAFLCAGAYGHSMASNYNLHNIAGELLVDGKKIKEISKPIDWREIYKISEEI